MAHDPEQIEQLARTYTEAWCSRDPARVAGHYVTDGMITINGGDAAPIAEVGGLGECRPHVVDIGVEAVFHSHDPFALG